MKKIWAVFLCLTLAACATPPPTPRPGPLFSDSLFSPPKERISADDVFALSDEMREFLNTRIAEQLNTKGRRQALFDALYDKKQLKLDYDATFTRNAAQAFAARTGNCLSLVIMTGAFARELKLQVSYQRVLKKESWSRSDDLHFANEHVNLSLGSELVQTPSLPNATGVELSYLMTIDFVSPEEMLKQRRRVISEKTVVAMFMNNRAAESLSDGRVDDAYWWARASIGEDPKFLEAYNTLGVVYRRHGNLQLAEKVLAHVLDLEPANLPALTNQSLTLVDLGRATEARALNEKIQQIRAYPPFYFFDQGVTAMQQGNFKAARELFAKEVDRDQYYHEFHAWLAAAYAGLGDEKQVRKHLTLAMENSPTRREHDLYAAKLGLAEAH